MFPCWCKYYGSRTRAFEDVGCRVLLLARGLRQDESEDAHNSADDDDIHCDEFSGDLYSYFRGINNEF